MKPWHKMVYKLCLFFLLVLSVECWSTDSRSSKRASIPLIIDSDADLGDMMAILYLLKIPHIDVKAITTVGTGVSRWEYGAQNLSNLLELAGHPRIPVAYGERQSLSPSGTMPPDWRTEADQVMQIKLTPNPIHPIRMRASKLMATILRSSPQKVSILCLGPLTNIATLLASEPDIANKIEHIYFAGGAIMVPGNIEGRPQGVRNNVAEYNVFLDAKAAHDVFMSNIPMTLIPLDVVQHVPVTLEFFKQLAQEKSTPSANFVYEVINPYNSKRHRARKYFFYSVAAVLLTEPHIASYREFKLAVHLKKGTEYGRLMINKAGSTLHIPTSIDAHAFYTLFLRALNRSTVLNPNHSESY